MAELDLEPSQSTLNANVAARGELTYVGREFLMGVVGRRVIQIYGLSGRSDPSRDREFQMDGQSSIRTAAPGKTEAEMQEVADADLIYYKAMLQLSMTHVVSNGAQTSHVAEAIVRRAASLKGAVKTAPKVLRADGTEVDLSSYEPDSLHTPRITGVINLWGGPSTSFALAIVRKVFDSAERIYSVWDAGTMGLDKLPSGVAYGIRTYRGEGGSTESFDDQPYTLPLPNTAEEAADMYIDTTPRENLVAVAVKEIDRRTGAVRFVIRNGLQAAA